MMIPSSASKILIGIPLDANVSVDLLGWAIRVIARPGDSIIALHVIGAMENKNKRQSARKQQKQFRQAKSFVINIIGELVKACRSNEVNMEARVGASSSPGRGLVEEARNMGADYLIIGGTQRRRSNRSSTISHYCCTNVPQGCSLVMLRPTQQPNLPEFEHESSSSWSEKNLSTENSFSSEENESHVKLKRPSPRTVLGICEEDLDSGESSDSCSVAKSTVSGKPNSPFRLISSLFRPSFDWRMAKKNHKGKNQSMLKCFTYQQIATATKSFHNDNLIGQGGYSEVYKGVIGDGSHIAVKRLAKDNNNATKEKEFLMELGIIGHVNHPNTAQLLGYCIENGLHLIFQFYPNGTLSSALHGQASKGLDWPTRYRIVLGIAKGLHYLHKCCKHRIIHRDIKASNVLLGPHNEPQISDFGLAKWLPSKWSYHAVIPIEGTFGYLAPEYFMHGIVDEKIDVYAFGILLLEILTGRRPVDATRQNLLLWARPLMESGNLRELADPKMKGRFDMEQLYRVALTASYCVRQSSIWRPSMIEVLQLLTYGQDSEVGRSSWRIPKFTSDEMDDYSMIFGYKLPSDLSLEDI
ncbi:probable receptor-like serine/threonine-protein kinase At5g57670 isoform X1 [Salvia splendens]|uniref:probable receptor-like serine/threonine-protein kinase At5g57670 isoform X1 n=1 Tax=Salvia splendens TaxID=180675 RepID=UPI001C275A57|nr:probable receptor-like serine/threonine-protein kinase At5g57670 isoform X1 [Salvia splendens]